MIALIDTHAHIDLPVFDEDREAMLVRARDAGVVSTIVIGHNPDRWAVAAEMCRQHPCLAYTAGLHPNDAATWSDSLENALDTELATGRAIAVGETGLDFFRDSAPEDLQRQAFVAQINLARRYDLPVVIHQRSAEQEVLDLLAKHGPVRGVMHCFSGDSRFAHSCLASGMQLGIGGVVTYPKSEVIRDAVASVPLGSLILETDAPYLAPQSRRGKRNEPGLIVEAATTLASIHNVSLEEIAEQTSTNAIRLFGPELEHVFRAGLGGGR